MEKEQATDPTGICHPAHRFDLNRATTIDGDAEAVINDMFVYHAWDDAQTNAGALVRNCLADAVKMIVKFVPPCPDRSAAIRKLREARMDCNSAITHRGKY